MAALSGSNIWCIVILQIGMALGARWHVALFLNIQRYTIPGLGALTLGIILYFCIACAIKRYIYQRLQKEVNPQVSESEQTESELLEV